MDSSFQFQWTDNSLMRARCSVIEPHASPNPRDSWYQPLVTEAYAIGLWHKKHLLCIGGLPHISHSQFSRSTKLNKNKNGFQILLFSELSQAFQYKRLWVIVEILILLDACAFDSVAYFQVYRSSKMLANQFIFQLNITCHWDLSVGMLRKFKYSLLLVQCNCGYFYFPR